MIYGHDGSEAQEYAKKYGRKFVSMDSEPIIGDANYDGELNIRDAALIARKLVERKTDELPQWADYNEDGEVNIRDAASIARKLADRYVPKPTPSQIKKPNKKDYNLNEFSGMQAYVNDFIKYRAKTAYGITHILYDDTIDPWSGYSWDVPAVYIPNVDYYLEQNNGILEIGSFLYEMPQGYDGWESVFHIAKNKEEMADMLVNSAYTDLKMLVDEWKAQDSLESIPYAGLTITWRSLGGGNYEIYVMWVKDSWLEDTVK